MNKAWFGPKFLAGWGVSPISWEGWLLTVIYIVILVLIGRYPEIAKGTSLSLKIVASCIYFSLVYITYGSD